MRREHVPVDLIEVVLEPFLAASDLPPGWRDVAGVSRPARRGGRGSTKNFQALRAALEEIAKDVSLVVSADEEAGGFVIGSTTAAALDAVVERLQTDYGQFVKAGAPQVAYRETILSTAEADYTHKHLIDGAGEFARVALRVEPAFDCVTPFVQSTETSRISPKFLRGVEQGVASVLRAGPESGFPFIDVRVTLVDVAFHDTDSSADAFRIAAAAAIRNAVLKAGVVAVEPTMAISVSAPAQFRAAVIADIRTRRGRLQSDQPADDDAIEAAVPLSNLLGYGNTLRSMTCGAGCFAIRGFDSYRQIPPHFDPDDGPAAAAIA